MRVKKTKDRNEYIRAGGLWVRNFTNYGLPFLNINKMFDHEDYQGILKNEMANRIVQKPPISEETFHFPKIVIVSDGYGFAEKHRLLEELPSDVAIIAVNGALVKWKLLTPPSKGRVINFYVVNNPYDECKRLLPRRGPRYFPSCIASSRTNPEFISNYIGNTYLYEPSQNINFGKPSADKYCIDDYRNPICASIGLAYQFGVEKLMLFCCDDSFEDERPAAEKLQNGLWTYPQQLKSHDIIDANLYWLTHQENMDVQASDHSSGPEYINAEYITSEEAVIAFFEDTVLSGV